MQIGLLPNTEWLKGTVALSPRGEIVVDERGQTSLPGVFAAGDATTVPYKQIVIAMGEGSKAALSAFDHLIRTLGCAGRSRVADGRRSVATGAISGSGDRFRGRYLAPGVAAPVTPA